MSGGLVGEHIAEVVQFHTVSPKLTCKNNCTRNLDGFVQSQNHKMYVQQERKTLEKIDNLTKNRYGPEKFSPDFHGQYYQQLMSQSIKLTKP